MLFAEQKPSWNHRVTQLVLVALGKNTMFLASSSCGVQTEFLFEFRNIGSAWVYGFCLHGDLIDQLKGAAL
jgi:hypothetical protein